MRLEDIDFGFVEIIEKANVEKIICRYNGTCTVCFYDKPPKELHIECSSYNRQYGIPISNDGTKLFVGNWEKGLFAYSIDSGEILWKFKPGKIRDIFVYSNFLIVSRAYAAIVKIDIETGAMLGSIKSGTLEHVFYLDSTCVFADTVSGKHAIIDVQEMVVIKKYDSKIVNPYDCLSFTITDAGLQNNILTICGIEEYPQRNFNPKIVLGGKAFSRIIDHNLKGKEDGAPS